MSLSKQRRRIVKVCHTQHYTRVCRSGLKGKSMCIGSKSKRLSKLDEICLLLICKMRFFQSSCGRERGGRCGCLAAYVFARRGTNVTRGRRRRRMTDRSVRCKPSLPGGRRWLHPTREAQLRVIGSLPSHAFKTAVQKKKKKKGDGKARRVSRK